MKRRYPAVLKVLFAALFALVATEVRALPANFQAETILDGLVQPVYLEQLPDGRMLLGLKQGRILIFNPNDPVPTPRVYLDIVDIDTGGERGLTSFAIDPNFESNGFIYVYYTHGTTRRNRVARFSHIEDRADPASEVLIWQYNRNFVDCCHYGGGIGFGPDGKLYLTTGEEFDGAQAQDLTRGGGKIIRINPDGSIPADNPFVNGPAGALPEIWAYGLRNPYRAHWDLVTGRLFIAEVGGNVQTLAREDIHLGRAGANYGWPYCEGKCNDPRYDDPIYDYGHIFPGGEGGAVTLGAVYRGSQFPSNYQGVLFFTDYVQGWIRYLTFDQSGAVAGVHNFADQLGPLVHLIVGQDGALYAVDIMGSVKRISYSSGNLPPQIEQILHNPTPGPAPVTVAFDVVASDPENDPLTYRWLLGDGTELTGKAVNHQYASNGVYQVRVQVSDGNRTTTSAPVTVMVGNPPVVTITQPADGALFRAGDVINFAGTATHPTEVLGPEKFSWTVRFWHNSHTHPAASGHIGTSGSFEINTSGHDYHDNTRYEIELTVTDSDGLSATDRVFVYPDKTDLQLQTSPIQAPILVDGLPLQTPIAYDTLIGFNHVVSVPPQQCVDDVLYRFSSWSDGGALTHQITIPPTGLALTAYFAPSGPCSEVVTNGLVLHLEADEGVVATGDGRVVSWSDQSGLANDLVAAGDPRLVTGAINGRPALDFDGDGDKLERTAFLQGFPAGSSDRTVYVVANYRGGGYGGFGFGNAACNKAFGLQVTPSGSLMVQGWCEANDFVSNRVGSGAGWLMQSAVVESNQLRHYLNGELIASHAKSFDTVLARVVLGARLDSVSYVDMQVAAVLVYNRALTAAERAQVDNYLLQKYFGTSINQPPTAADDAGGVMYGGSATIDVLANDSDPEGQLDPASVMIVQQPAHGTLQIDTGTGVVTYTHGRSGGSTSDSFQYRVADAEGALSNIATVNIQIAVPDAAISIVAPAAEGLVQGPQVTLNFQLSGTDYSHLLLSLDGATPVTVMHPTGSYTFNNVAPGAHTLTATLVDAGHQPVPAPNAVQTVRFYVTDALGSPLALDDDAQALRGQTSRIDVLANDRDVDGTLNPASVYLTAFPLSGTAVVDPVTGHIDYTHNGDSSTSDSFRYRVLDDNGLVSNEAEVTLTIGEPLPRSGLVLHLEADQGVSVAGGVVTGWADQSGLGNDLLGAGGPRLLSGVLNGRPVLDFDGVGAKLERTDTLHGLPAGNADRSVFLVANYRGTGYGGFAYGNIACNQTFGTVVDPAGRLMVQGWCQDFASNTAGTGSGWLVQAAVHSGGQLRHYRNGELIDSRNHNYNTVLTRLVLGAEIDSSPYIDMQVAAVLVYDRALSASEQAEVQNYLQAKYFGGSSGNPPPVAVDDTATVSSGGTVSINVLANDGDANGVIDPGSVTITRAPTAGSAEVDPVTGVVVYSHHGAGSSDSFQYTVADEQGAVSNVATVTITVIGGSQGPVANADTATVVRGRSVAIDVLANDSGDGGQIAAGSVQIVAQPTYGVASVDPASGIVTYQHGGLAMPTDSFQYRVANSAGVYSSPAVVTIEVVAPNAQVNLTSPTAGGLVQGPTVTVTYTLGGSDYDHLHLSLDGQGHSTISELTGSYTFHDVAPGPHTITATLVDASHLPVPAPGAEQTVQFYVTDAAGSPLALDDSAQVARGRTSRIDVLANDRDVDGTLNPASVYLTMLPQWGVAVVDPVTGHIDYSHDGGASTSDSFRYRVLDDNGLLSNEAEVTLTIGEPLPRNGLVLHLEADQGVSVAGGVVTGWSDQSGLGNDLQGVGGPRLLSGVLNGRPVLDFDGVGAKLERTDTLHGLPAGNADRSVFLVANYRGTGYGGFAYGHTGCNQTFGTIVDDSGLLMVQGWCGGRDFASPVLGTGAGWLVQSAVLSDGWLRHYHDGTLIGTHKHNFNTVLTRLVLGAEIDSSPYIDMQVAAVLVYDRALSAEEQVEVLNYLQSKYFAE